MYNECNALKLQSQGSSKAINPASPLFFPDLSAPDGVQPENLPIPSTLPDLRSYQEIPPLEQEGGENGSVIEERANRGKSRRAKQGVIPFASHKRLRLRARKNPDKYASRKIPDEELEEISRIANEFYEWCDRKSQKFALLANFKNDIYRIVDALTSTRYDVYGLGKIKKRIKRRMGKRFMTQALMVTLEFDSNRFTIAESWGRARTGLSTFLDAVNITRKRQGLKRLCHYVSVLQPHKSGMCHIHIAFPGLRFLDYRLLERLWKNGFVHISSKDNVNLTSYVCRYISEFGLDDLANSMLWYFRTRLYSLSHSFVPVKEETEKGDWWVYPCLKRKGQTWKFVKGLLQQGYPVPGLDRFLIFFPGVEPWELQLHHYHLV